VSSVVVEDEVEITFLRRLPVDGPQEAQELLMAVAFHALPDHRTAGDIERGKQGSGAMALVVVRHGAGSALFHRQPWLSTVERLDLALLVDTQHEGSVRRAEVEADDILHLLDEPLVVRQLEPAREMGLQPVRMPNPPHTGVAEADGLGHRPSAPMRGCLRLLAQRLLYYPGNHFRRQRRLAARTGGIALQPGDPLRKVALLPPPHRRLALTDRAHDRHCPVTCRR
jgi:hypothetical protein